MTEQLSPAELKVYQLIVAGMSNQAIADVLFIQEKSVKFHITTIFKKLCVQSRYELIVQHFRGELTLAKRQHFEQGFEAGVESAKLAAIARGA